MSKLWLGRGFLFLDFNNRYHGELRFVPHFFLIIQVKLQEFIMVEKSIAVFLLMVMALPLMPLKSYADSDEAGTTSTTSSSSSSGLIIGGVVVAGLLTYFLFVRGGDKSTSASAVSCNPCSNIVLNNSSQERQGDKSVVLMRESPFSFIAQNSSK